MTTCMANHFFYNLVFTARSKAVVRIGKTMYLTGLSFRKCFRTSALTEFIIETVAVVDLSSDPSTLLNINGTLDYTLRVKVPHN